MFNILIAKANTYLDAQKCIKELYIEAEKKATPGSCVYSYYLDSNGAVRKIKQTFETKWELKEACWDCRLDPDKVVTIAKWLRRHKVDKVSMMTGARLLYTLA